MLKDRCPAPALTSSLPPWQQIAGEALSQTRARLAPGAAVRLTLTTPVHSADRSSVGPRTFPLLSQRGGAPTSSRHQHTISSRKMPKVPRKWKKTNSMAVGLLHPLASLTMSPHQCYLEKQGPFKRVEMSPQKRKKGKWTVKLNFHEDRGPIAVSEAASHTQPLALRISRCLMERREIPVTTRTVLMS